MAKLSIENVKHDSPSWMVAITTVLAIITAYGPDAITSLPGTVSQETKDWIEWIFKNLTILSGVLTLGAKGKSMFTKTELIGSRDKDDR